MRYTIWSQGQLVGDTELGAANADDRHRIGWLRASAAGETVLGRLTTPEPMPGLELRDASDTVIPTVDIAIRDVDDLIALSQLLDDDDDDAWTASDDDVGLADQSDGVDDELDAFGAFDPFVTNGDSAWARAAASGDAVAKYQVHVVLSDPDGIG